MKLMKFNNIKKLFTFLPAPSGRLSLSFAKPEYLLLRNLQLLMGCLVIGSLLFTGWCWTQYFKVQRLIQTESNSLLRIRNANQTFQNNLTREGLNLTSLQIGNIKARTKFVNLLNKKRSFSWTKLLENLSEALPSTVSIESVRLNFKDSNILLSGKVKTLDNLNTLVHSLENNKMFRSVKVKIHHFENYQEKTTSLKISQRNSLRNRTHSVVQFQLSVAYRPIF